MAGQFAGRQRAARTGLGGAQLVVAMRIIARIVGVIAGVIGVIAGVVVGRLGVGPDNAQPITRTVVSRGIVTRAVRWAVITRVAVGRPTVSQPVVARAGSWRTGARAGLGAVGLAPGGQILASVLAELTIGSRQQVRQREVTCPRHQQSAVGEGRPSGSSLVIPRAVAQVHIPASC